MELGPGELGPGEAIVVIDDHEVAVNKEWWSALSMHQFLVRRVRVFGNFKGSSFRLQAYGF